MGTDPTNRNAAIHERPVLKLETQTRPEPSHPQRCFWFHVYWQLEPGPVSPFVATAVIVAAKKHVPRDGEARLVWARFSWDHNEPGQCFRVAAYPDGTESIDEVRL